MKNFSALIRGGHARISTASILLLILPQSLRAQRPAIDHDLAAAAFAEVADFVKRDNGQLWGSPLGGPLMVVDPATRYAVTSSADSRGTFTRAGTVFAGVLPTNLNVANTAVEWAGVTWTMVMWPAGESRHQRTRVFAHELLHRLQKERQWKIGDVTNAHLDSEAGRTWLRLELRALEAAVTRSGAARKAALADALAFRAQRRTLAPGAAVEERMLELVEGTAEYTGFRLSGLSSEQLADSVAVQLHAFERRDSFARSFAYATGPAYGILLDAVRARWRRPDALDMSEAVRTAYRIGETQLDDVAARAAKYDGAAVMSQESERATRMAARLAELRSRFVDGPVLRVLPNSAFSMSFDPNGAESLGGLGTVYPATRISDVWGVLTVESGGALFLSPEPGMYTGVVVAAARGTGPPLSGPGWKLELTAGWAVRPDARAGDWVVTRPKTE